MIVVIDNYDSFTYNLVHYVGEFEEKVKVIRNDEMSIVDVMALTRTTNNITDLFEGYQVNLLNTVSSAAKLTSTVDTTNAKTNLKRNYASNIFSIVSLYFVIQLL